MQIELPHHVYISPTVFFTGSGDKRDFFYTEFIFSLNVKKQTKKKRKHRTSKTVVK